MRLLQNFGITAIKTILNSTHDGIIAIDLQENIIIFNKAAEHLIGINMQEALKSKIKKIVPTTRLPQVMRSGNSELYQEQEINNTKIITNRMPVFDQCGKITGAVAVFHDISEAICLANQITNLQEVQKLLEAIINSTEDAISVVDENGLGILINPAYTRLTGLTAKDVIKKPATVDIAEGESVHYQVLNTRRPIKGAKMKVGPSKKEVIVNVAPIIVNDELKGSVGVIHDISEIKKLTDELEKAQRLIRHLNAKYTFEDIVGESIIMHEVMAQAQRAAATPATILLRGESGTGKELFAHAIHNSSKRSLGQFVRVNCAALSDSLLESELFGYAEGAFTGAQKGGKVGLFEEASGGTLFLDEVGEVSLSLQTKLLRVLQEKEIVRVGDTRPRRIDVRIIAATNSNLEEAVLNKRFREDLYYRLNVIPINVPSLRERKEDLEKLVNFILRKLNQDFGRNIESIDIKALKLLDKYDWPGNVRELENVLGRAAINMKFNEKIMRLDHLPRLKEIKNHSNDLCFVEESISTYDESFNTWERNLLEKILGLTKNNKTETSKVLNISLRNLYYKLKKHNLQ